MYQTSKTQLYHILVLFPFLVSKGLIVLFKIFKLKKANSQKPGEHIVARVREIICGLESRCFWFALAVSDSSDLFPLWN